MLGMMVLTHRTVSQWMSVQSIEHMFELGLAVLSYSSGSWSEVDDLSWTKWLDWPCMALSAE